jgi:hypothetical protein
MPEGAVYVGRPSRWGNPFRTDDRTPTERLTREYATERFRERFADLAPQGWFAPLKGRDLVCWCALDQPCHADVLLELANG